MDIVEVASKAEWLHSVAVPLDYGYLIEESGMVNSL